MKEQTYDHLKSKKQILSAAIKEFADNGFAGARMGAIAQRANVNQALIHYYFNNKETLYKEVLSKLFGIEYRDSIIMQIKKIEHDYNLTPTQKLYLGIYILVNMHLELHNPDFSRIILREITEDRKHIKQIVKDYLMPRHEILESIIIEGIQCGEFESKNPLYVVMGINNFIISYINTKTMMEDSEWYNKVYGGKRKEDLFEFLVDNTFKALRPENKPLIIPALPESVIKIVDELIAKFNREIKSEFNYEVFS